MALSMPDGITKKCALLFQKHTKNSPSRRAFIFICSKRRISCANYPTFFGGVVQYARLLASIVREATARIFTHPPFPYFFFYDSRKTVKNQAISEKTGFLRTIFDTSQKYERNHSNTANCRAISKASRNYEGFPSIIREYCLFSKASSMRAGIRLLDGKALDMCALRVPAYCPPIGKYPKFLV